MFVVRCEVTGLREMRGFLRNLDEKTTKKTLKKAVRAGAKIIQAAVKAAAPVRKNSSIPGYSGGLLKRSIIVKIGTNKAGTIYAMIGPGKAFKTTRPRGGGAKVKVLAKAKRLTTRGGRSVLIAPAYYAHLVELGVKAHQVGPGKPHPGFPAKPFLRPAFNATVESAKLAMIDVVRQEMN